MGEGKEKETVAHLEHASRTESEEQKMEAGEQGPYHLQHINTVENKVHFYDCQYV